MKQFILLWLCLAVTAWGQYVPRPTSSGVATTDFDTFSELNTILTDADLAAVGEANLFTNLQSITRANAQTQTNTITGLGTTTLPGLQLTNTTAAAAGAQQYSPALRFTGQGWKTNATAGSQSTEWRAYVVPIQSTANPASNFVIDTSVNGAAFGAPVLFQTTASAVTGLTLSDTAGIGFINGLTAATSTTGGNVQATLGVAQLFAPNSFVLKWSSLTAGATNIFGGGTSGTLIRRATENVVGLGAAGAGNTFSTSPTSPAQITADQNNYNPGGSSYYQRWSTDASRNITGMTFTAAQVDGQTHVIANVGAQNIVIVNESASSTAANRFHNSTGADITIAADQEVNCWYDSTTARWRVTKRGF